MPTIKSLAVYMLFVIFSLILSEGAVIAAFSDCIPLVGINVLLFALPLAAQMLIAAYVNYSELIPRFFMKGRLLGYLCRCFLLAMAVPMIGIAMEFALRHHYGLPDRIHNYLSPWILVDSLSTASLLMVIMIGMGVVKVYRFWKTEVDVENLVTAEYNDASAQLKDRIQPDEILDSLATIRATATRDADEANDQLRALSSQLRSELYDRPPVKAPWQKNEELIRGNAYSDSNSDFSWLEEFIGAKRFTFLRDICLKLFIACVAVTAIFEAPDRPELTLNGLWAFLGMFVALG